MGQGKAAFVQEVEQPQSQISLARAALLFAAYLGEQPFDPSLYEQTLKDMAESVRPKMQAAQSDQAQIAALNHYLFDELQFIGNSDNYYHPDNSFLNKVLDLRRGIPISLSVIYLEIGWRLGLPLCGLSFPRHFMVGYDIQQAGMVIDVFDQGKILTIDDCLDFFQLPQSDLIPFKQEHFQPATKKAILFRMLLNLKQLYVTLKDWPASYKTVDLMLQLEPDLPGELRDRGLIAYRLNRLQDAIYDVKQYLISSPDSRDADWLRAHVTQMEERLGRLN